MKNETKKVPAMSREEIKKLAEETYRKCIKKFDIYLEKYSGEPYELAGCKDGNYFNGAPKRKLKVSSNWLTSCITGLAPLYYRTEKDKKLLEWAEKFAPYYKDKVFDTPAYDTMHDLGFLYSPYSVAMYQLTGDKKHRETALKAADELAKRFHIKTGCIEAWGNQTYQYLRRPVRLIIDTLMNLPLLWWAWSETKHNFYIDVAKAHIEMVKKYLLREDGSVAHAFMFDRATGEVIEECNSCGYSNGSYWARGTSWAICGFAIAGRYLESKDEFLLLAREYQAIAERLADNYIKTIGKGNYVPVWDFRLPKDAPATACGSKPEWDETKAENCIYNVDTSACAVVARGLMELLNHKENPVYRDFVDNSIRELCQNYFEDNPDIPGLLRRQNGNDTYTTFGDFYLAEALQSYLDNGMQNCW